jgi:membrane protein YdbS with pleckstrin-like domain
VKTVIAPPLAVGDAVALHPGANHLDHREGAVAFVEVEHRRVNVKRVEQSDATDTEEQLLANPDPRIAAIEAGGQGAIRFVVLGDVRVEQVESRPADLDPPDPRLEDTDMGVDRDPDIGAVERLDRLDRQHVDLGIEVVFLLPAVLIKLLLEIPLRIEQADADERDAEVTGALQVVASENAEASRINRQALMEAELGREVGDRPGLEGRGVQRPPRLVALEIFRETPEGVVDPRMQRGLFGGGFENVARNPIKEFDRIVIGLAPEIRVEDVEKSEVVRLPGPPKVARKFSQLLDDVHLSRHAYPLHPRASPPRNSSPHYDMGVPKRQPPTFDPGRASRGASPIGPAIALNLVIEREPIVDPTESVSPRDQGDPAMAEPQMSPTLPTSEVSTVNVGPMPTVTPAPPPQAMAPIVPGAPANAGDPTDPINGIGIEGEEDVWEGRYSYRNFLGRISLRIVLSLAWFVLAVYTWGYDHTNLNIVAVIFGVVVLAMWFGLVILLMQARLGHHYRLTTRRLFVSTGVFQHERDQMELLRVQDVFTRQQTLADRLLGLGTVVVVPSDKRLPTLNILGVDDPKAIMDLVWHHARAEQDQRNVRVEAI